jgi:hypothetical protein
MARRAKVKRSAAKQAKLERRREEHGPEWARRQELWQTLRRAWEEYEKARKRDPDCPVVCERCGLLQDYEVIDWPAQSPTAIGLFEAMTKITPCPGPLELGCGGLYCITIEHYEEETPPEDLK